MAFGARTDTAKGAFDRGDHYVARVNKDRLDVERHTDFLNDAWARGYRLQFCFEQHGNTLMIFEQRT
jgi:hypothetical protein